MPRCQDFALLLLLPWLACYQFWRHLARSWAYPLMGIGDD